MFENSNRKAAKHTKPNAKKNSGGANLVFALGDHKDRPYKSLCGKLFAILDLAQIVLGMFWLERPELLLHHT